jgi:two-component system response regulator GlrR
MALESGAKCVRALNIADGKRVLLVDDDPSVLKVIAIRLKRAGYVVKTADSSRKALSSLSAFSPQVVVTDMRMEGMTGLELFDAIHDIDATIPVIMLTAHGTIPDAVDATQRGIFAYLTKPFEKDELLEVVDRAARIYGDHTEQDNEQDGEWCKAIVTRSPAMQALLREAWLVAQSDSSVLIRGESGTGKELLADAIHQASTRKDRPLVAVNCAAIPEQLFEDELFGHAKGAFTGAAKARRGLIQEADGGTLFLDEIGDMPLQVQTKLLRVIQEREVRPVGSDESIGVDVRIISATHQDLEASLKDNAFREDLFYRLNVLTLDIPSLAERREDIPLLAEHLLTSSEGKSQRAAQEVKGFSKEATELMMMAAWPGNVRQLRNAVEQCAVLTTTPLIPVNLVERALRSTERALLPFGEARDGFEYEYLTNLLAMTEGNVAQAARLAGRNRSEFYKLLHKHELEPELFRKNVNSEDD